MRGERLSAVIRRLGPDELSAFLDVLQWPYAFDRPAEETERDEETRRFADVLDPARAFVVDDGGRLVGTLGCFDLRMTVPGGEIACGGTTVVGVHATHRRRGLLRELMAAHLREVREHGDPIAALWASDSGIYGRFGYGMAAVGAEYEIDRSHVGFHRLAAEPAPVEHVAPGAAEEILPAVFERLMGVVPGVFARTPAWWRNRRLRDPAGHREGATAFRFAVATGPDGTPSGYAMYRTKSSWEQHHGAFEVRVVELVALDAAAAAGLWGVLLSTDLATRIVAEHRPADDPLLDLLAAPRRAAPTLTDSLWVRLVDVAAALTARHYGTAGSLVIATRDPLDGASSVWRLSTDGRDSTCEPSGDEPDLWIDLEDLGACYLGRARFRALARAARVRGTAKALARADALFGWDPQPWCPQVF